MMRVEGEESKLLYDLCSILLTILKSPHQLTISSSSPPSSSMVSSSSVPRRTRTTITTTTTTSTQSIMSQVSPAGFASLLLGVSLALMLCGSVTFVIGFILMPWVLGLVMVLYLVGIVSNLSSLGRAILYPNFSSSSRIEAAAAATSPKDISELKFL